MNAPSTRIDLLRPRLSLVKPVEYETPATVAAGAGETGSGETPMAKHSAKAPKNKVDESSQNEELEQLLRDQERDRLAASHGKSLLAKKDARDRKGFGRVGRHDAKRSAAGFTLADDGLLEPTKSPYSPATERIDKMGRQIICALAGMYFVPPGADTKPVDCLSSLYEPPCSQYLMPNFLHVGMMERAAEMMQAARLGGVVPVSEESIGKAYEALFGFSYDYPKWRFALIELLELNALANEGERLRAAHGASLTWKPPGTPSTALGSLERPLVGRQICARLRRDLSEEAVPRELTPAEVDRMITKVGVSRGGCTGKKSARSVVDQWAIDHEPTKVRQKPPKKPKKAGRRISRS